MIVTHRAPDLDAVGSVWILKRFDEQHYGKADLFFVNAGDRMSPVDLQKRELSDDDVSHVDTGLGEFDHHTKKLANKRVCAASLVRDHVVRVHPELEGDEALERMTDFMVDIDHFGEFFWPEPNDDRYLFGLVEILHHLKNIGHSDEQVVEFGMVALDSIYSAFKSTISAEKEMKVGVKFKTKWGKGLGVETTNDEVIKYAQRAGYSVVVRKDLEFGNIRIKAVPGKKIDLTQVYEKIKKLDSQGTWYFHPGKTMLLNASRKGSSDVASELTLKQVMEILKSDKDTSSNKP